MSTQVNSGFLISDDAAKEKAAAEKENIIIWELSRKEKAIIQQLGKQAT